MYDGVLSSERQPNSILAPTITLVSDCKLLTSRVKPPGYMRRGERERKTNTNTCTCVRAIVHVHVKIIREREREGEEKGEREQR